MPISVTPAIPASQIVQINPSVLGAGGDALDLIGLMLTTTSRIPIGTVLSFADVADVGDYFGPSSQEAALGTIYFLGPNNSTAKPGALLFAQYPLAAVDAFLRGGDVSSLSLATLQSYTGGSLNVTIDGVSKTSNPSIGSATSFSNAANVIGSALAIHGVSAASFTGAISGTTLSVSAVSSGTLSLSDVVGGTGVSGTPYIVSQLGGTTGSTGTYQLSTSQVTGTQAMTGYLPGVTYDSISGAFTIFSGTTGVGSTITYASGTLATNIKLTAATGAVLSQGAAATTPTDFMPGITALTQNWASFMTLFEPSEADKILFATWSNGQNNRYVYEMWDTNASNAAGSASTAVAYVTANDLSGVEMIYEDPTIDTVGAELAAFAMSWTASLDFARFNGHSTQKFKGQSGLQPQVTDGTTATNLTSVGMNFYGDYTTANEAFLWWAEGSISGPFLWKDAYVEQIQLNQALQLALMTLLNNVGAVSYNQYGYGLISAAVQDPINVAVNYGSITSGIQLSEAQKAQIIGASGVAEAPDIIQQRGWYFQVVPANAAVRAARLSPSCTLWYAAGNAIQRIVLASIAVQ